MIDRDVNNCTALRWHLISYALSFHQTRVTCKYGLAFNRNLDSMTGDFVVIGDRFLRNLFSISRPNRFGNRMVRMALRISSCLQQFILRLAT
ncbi:hypothetical protein D3C78_1415140 [compost metagenome]